MIWKYCIAFGMKSIIEERNILMVSNPFKSLGWSAKGSTTKTTGKPSDYGRLECGCAEKRSYTSIYISHPNKINHLFFVLATGIWFGSTFTYTQCS